VSTLMQIPWTWQRSKKDRTPAGKGETVTSLALASMGQMPVSRTEIFYS